MRLLLLLVSRFASVVYFMAHPAVPRWVKLLPWLAMLYILWPVDLLFDFPPGVGHVDDALVVFLILTLFTYLSRRYVAKAAEGPSEKKEPGIKADYRVLDDNDDEEDEKKDSDPEDESKSA